MNKAWSHLSVFDLTFQIHTHFELTGCTADLFFFDSAKSWSMRLNPVACETNILYNKHCAWLRLHHDIHSIHIYIYIYIWYMCPQSCSTSSVGETKKPTSLKNTAFLFTQANITKILPNNPSMTCEITILLGSLHPYIQVDHRNIHIPSIEGTSQRLK